MIKLFTHDDFMLDYENAKAAEEKANTKSQPMIEQLMKAKEALEESNSWLARMSELKWDDETYAPKFKASFLKQKQILSDLNNYLATLKQGE
jgi:hypothetical protein